MIRALLGALPNGACCEVKTGLLTLADCGRYAHLQCPRCGKFLCARHAVNEPHLRCTECYGTEGPDDDGAPADDPGAPDSAAAFLLRDRKGLERRPERERDDDDPAGGFGSS